MIDYKFSVYESMKSQEASDLSIDNYIGYIKHGANQDLVLKARTIYQKEGNSDAYKALKNTSKVITGSCVYESGKPKVADNIKAMNNLIVIDIDEAISEEKYYELRGDKYTYVIHRSFSGSGFCIFVKIDSERFEDSFLGLSQYYFDNYNITIDQSCSNKNRLRFISWDSEIHQNEKSNKFIPKNVKKFQAPKSSDINYVFHQDDFDNILRQIQEGGIDLCQEDYFRYVRIGMSIADKFGFSGADKFHFICSMGGKYNKKRAEHDYNGFVKNNQHKCSIGTFYYYCKEAGIDIYTEKTKTIINRVKIAKSQGNPTIESIVSNLKVANSITPSANDLSLINELILSKNDYSKEANADLTEIEQVIKFVLDTYSPHYDEISNKVFMNGKAMEDKGLNDIYLNCKKSFDFKVPVTDIMAILNSNQIKNVNNLSNFIKEYQHLTPTGVIDDYISCIHPRSEYNNWAFKRWIVGAVHNWTRDAGSTIVSPLTLVLTGQQHGTGKTSFLRNILPKELRQYFVQEKINSKDRDSMYRLSTSLMIFDDEFGGESFKDEKAFKALSDQIEINQRRPFAKHDSLFMRLAMLCGTSNVVDILKDITGNRRILPVKVESIEYERMMAINKIDLIIEAYNLLKEGFNFIIRTEEEIEYIRVNTEENTVVLPIEELFFKHFSVERSLDFPNEEVFNQNDMLEYLNKYSLLKPTKYDLREVLVKNKLIYKLHRIGEKVKQGVKLYLKGSTEVPKQDDKAPF